MKGISVTETTQDLPARLRRGYLSSSLTTLCGITHDRRCLEAADAITEQAAEIERLRAALEVIARGTSQVFDKNPQQMSGEEAKMIARAALEETKP